VKLFVAALLVAGGAFLFVEHQHAAAEARQLGTIASQIAGRPVRVHCQNIAAAAIDVSSEEGSVRFGPDGRPSDTAQLKRNTCAALGRFRADALAGKLACLAEPDSCPGRIKADARAAHVLTHESFHLRGISNEAAAECNALSTTAWTAEQLGASPQDAMLVGRYAREVLYPLLTADYHSAACRAF
jgi:hypothetical protein